MSAWIGAGRIIRFNWPSYAAALLIASAGFALALNPGPWRGAGTAAAAVAVLLSASSVLVSHWVYDLSELSDWRWLERWLEKPAGRWIGIQTGFDAADGRLAGALGGEPVVRVDLYGAAGIGGASVERARGENPGAARGTEAHLPEGVGICETIVAPFALHEIRDAGGRDVFFADAARALTPGGRLVAVEHLRDTANFLAFGPGFLHFLTEAEWRRCGDAAGLRLEKTRAITPFVRAFLWRKA